MDERKATAAFRKWVLALWLAGAAVVALAAPFTTQGLRLGIAAIFIAVFGVINVATFRAADTGRVSRARARVIRLSAEGVILLIALLVVRFL